LFYVCVRFGYIFNKQSIKNNFSMQFVKKSVFSALNTNILPTNQFCSLAIIRLLYIYSYSFGIFSIFFNVINLTSFLYAYFILFIYFFINLSYIAFDISTLYLLIFFIFSINPWCSLYAYLLSLILFCYHFIIYIPYEKSMFGVKHRT